MARRLAVALGLDPELLTAWATARGRADLGAALAAAARIETWLADTGRLPGEQRVAPGAAQLPVAPATSHEPTAIAAPRAIPDSIAIPILTEGSDPLTGDPARQAIETIRVERTLLPPLPAGARLVGYRLSAHGAHRIPESLRAGDCVIVLLGAEAAGPDTPCAVRVRSRVEIMRQQAGAPGGHLPPPQRATDSERLSTRAAHADSGAMIGRVVLAIRRWL